ncbi:MAG: SGNH/GDSL hydrolase family protein [Candidatus Dormibacteraceae bacterium]
MMTSLRTMRKTLPAAALVSALGLASPPAPAPALAYAAPAPEVRVLYLGASVMAGYYASGVSTTFAARLTGMLAAVGLKVEATTLARRGGRVEATGGWPLGGGYQLAVIHLVTNDYFAGTRPRRYRAAFEGLLARVRAGSPDAVLVCLGAWTGGRYANHAGATAHAYDEVVAAACRARGGLYVALTDIYWSRRTRGPAGRPTPWGLSDTFHPNDRGAEMIAARTFAALRRLAVGRAGGPALRRPGSAWLAMLAASSPVGHSAPDRGGPAEVAGSVTQARLPPSVHSRLRPAAAAGEVVGAIRTRLEAADAPNPIGPPATLLLLLAGAAVTAGALAWRLALIRRSSGRPPR